MKEVIYIKVLGIVQMKNMVMVDNEWLMAQYMKVNSKTIQLMEKVD